MPTGRPLTPDQDHQIARMYEGGTPIQIIGREFGITPRTVLAAYRRDCYRRGVAPRTRGPGRRCNPTPGTNPHHLPADPHRQLGGSRAHKVLVIHGPEGPTVIQEGDDL